MAAPEHNLVLLDLNADPTMTFKDLDGLDKELDGMGLQPEILKLERQKIRLARQQKKADPKLFGKA